MQKFGENAGRGVKPAQIFPAGGSIAGFFRQLARRGDIGVFAGVECTGGQFHNPFLGGGAKLAHQPHLVSRGEGGNHHRAFGADNLSLHGCAIGKRGFAQAEGEHFPIVNNFFADGIFRVHCVPFVTTKNAISRSILIAFGLSIYPAI